MSIVNFIPKPRKYAHPLAKKLKKIEGWYNQAIESGRHLRAARLLRMGVSTEEKIKALEK